MTNGKFHKSTTSIQTDFDQVSLSDKKKINIKS